MWRGSGNRMIRSLCKQFKQSAMPGPVKRLTPIAGGVGAPQNRRLALMRGVMVEIAGRVKSAM